MGNVAQVDGALHVVVGAGVDLDGDKAALVIFPTSPPTALGVKRKIFDAVIEAVKPLPEATELRRFVHERV